MTLLRSESITSYHSSGAWGKSSLLDLAKYGPADFYARHIAKTLPRKESEAFRFGNLFDGLMNDEATERARWAPSPPEDAPRRPSIKQREAKKPSPATVDAIAWWDNWDRVHTGKEEVKEEDREILTDMLAAVAKNEACAKLWAKCEKQVGVRRELDLDGFKITAQSRPDGLIIGEAGENPLFPRSGTIVDVKTCRDITRFPLDCLTFGYHVQLSLGQWLLAREGIQADAVLLVVEKKLRPRAKAFRLPEVALTAGWEKCKALLTEVAKRTRNNDWTDPQVEVEEIELPSWAVRQLESEAE